MCSVFPGSIWSLKDTTRTRHDEPMLTAKAIDLFRNSSVLSTQDPHSSLALSDESVTEKFLDGKEFSCSSSLALPLRSLGLPSVFGYEFAPGNLSGSLAYARVHSTCTITVVDAIRDHSL